MHDHFNTKNKYVLKKTKNKIPLAFRAASNTSSWHISTGASESMLAQLVIREKPKQRIPHWRATVTS
jgi:hypothetical protein